jgi:hypothetical protein
MSWKTVSNSNDNPLVTKSYQLRVVKNAIDPSLLD